MSSEAAQRAYPERVFPLYPEPPIGTWARDRFGGITYRQANGGWGQPGVMPFGKWEAMYDARGPYVETGPWGKPLGGGAMSTRDELASTIEDVEGRWDDLDAVGKPPGSLMPSFERMLADALIAEGWRKKPSREQIARWVWKRRIGPNGDESFDYLLAREARGREGVPQGIWDEADAVLALMDRGQ